MFFSFLSYIFLFFLSLFLFLLLCVPSLPSCFSLRSCTVPSSFISRFIYFSILSFFLIISLFLRILFLRFGLKNYDPGLFVSYATVPVPFALSYIWYLCRGSRVSPGFSHPRSLPLALSPSRPLDLSVLLYTHCEDLGNEVDPSPRPYPSTVSSVLLVFLLFLLSHLSPLLKAWRGCYADRNSI